MRHRLAPAKPQRGAHLEARSLQRRAGSGLWRRPLREAYLVFSPLSCKAKPNHTRRDRIRELHAGQNVACQVSFQTDVQGCLRGAMDAVEQLQNVVLGVQLKIS